MPTPLFVEPLQQLILHCEAWCDAAVRGASAGLPHQERASLLEELRALAAEIGLPPVADRAPSPPWTRALSLFRSALSAPDAAQCERALLQSYERVCDLEPPLRVSSTLLRHYGSIKRAAHLTSSAFSQVRGRAITPPSATPVPMLPVAATSR